MKLKRRTMKKRKVITYSILALLVTLFMISFYYALRETNDPLPDEESSYQDVYDTNEFSIYKQFKQLARDCSPEELKYQGEVSINNNLYYEYKLDEITLHAMNTNNKEELLQGDYTINYKNDTYVFRQDKPRYPEAIRIYNVDINKDSKNDIIIIGAPYSGTNNLYYWMHALDLSTMQEIPAFSSEERFITVEQEEQLRQLLSEDKEFQTLFSDMEGLNYSSVPMVDMFGNLYYDLGIGKDLMHYLGNVLVLFDYNKETKVFDVVDYVYMPNYIY